MSILEIYESMIGNQTPPDNFSENLLKLYESEGALDEWFEIIGNENPTIVYYAAVGLRLIIEKQWESIEGNELAEGYLERFLEVIC